MIALFIWSEKDLYNEQRLSARRKRLTRKKLRQNSNVRKDVENQEDFKDGRSNDRDKCK